jgi:hypothetical protein
MMEKDSPTGWGCRREFGFLCVLCGILCAKDTAKDAKNSLDYGFERTGHLICILLAFQNKNTASRIISGSMACL